MNILTIEVCNNREEADARKTIIKALAPHEDWQTRIAENISFVQPFLTPDMTSNPTPLPPVFTSQTGGPVAPAVVLFIWTEN